MANPLTLYVPIKQDDSTQQMAMLAYNHFVQSVSAGLDASQIVHYARLALAPVGANKPDSGVKIEAIILMTEFDQPMNEYLKLFWKTDSVKAAFIGIAKLMLNGPANPEKFEFDDFLNFINGNNLSKDTDNYSAYPQMVAQILDVFPLQGV